MRHSVFPFSIAMTALALPSCASGGSSAEANESAQAADESGDAMADETQAGLADMFSCDTAPGDESASDCVTDDPNPYTMPIGELTANIADLHPAYYYALASRLFEDGQRDESVVWFYAGQLRYRARLTCHPEFEASGEPALFGSLQMVIGTMINEYAGADPEKWAGAMQRALDWDAEHENGFEPKSACGLAIEQSRAGLTGLREQMLGSVDEIRATREANGLPNSGE